MAAMPNYQIISAPYPSGATWLVNCLLELGLRCRTFGAYWVPTADGGEGLWPLESLQMLLWHLPALHRHQGLRFDAGPTVFWDHRLSFARYPARKTVLFVRDPRDAVYSSICRRLNKLEPEPDELEQWLSQPESWPQYFPAVFDLPAADTLAYFYLFWLRALPADNLLVLRFEDAKRQPLECLRQVLEFFELERSEQALEQACQASSFERFQAIEQWMIQRTGQAKIVNRKGQSQEWKQSLPAASRRFFDGPAALAMQELGYETDPPGMSESALEGPAEFKQLLRTRQLNSALFWLYQRLAEPGLSAAQQNWLAGQLLALLWTRSILGHSEFEGPQSTRQATRIAVALTDLNARFAHWRPLQQVIERLQNPQHPLHQPKAFKGYGFYQPDLRSELPAVLQMDADYGIWLQPGWRLDDWQIMQLIEIIEEQIPELDAVVPELAQSAAERDSELGAEISYIRLQGLPVCMLFKLASLQSLPAELPLEQGLQSWLVAKSLGTKIIFTKK